MQSCSRGSKFVGRRAGRRKRATEAAGPLPCPPAPRARRAAAATPRSNPGRRAREFSSRGFRGRPPRRCGRARRRRQGHDLSLLPRQGEPVPGIDPHHADAVGRDHRGDGRRPMCRCRSWPIDRRSVRERGLRNPAQGRHAPDDLGRAARFPKLAEFYYREVLSRIIAAVRALLRARRRARRGAAKRSPISRKSSPRRAWSPSSGAACSNVSSRSTFAK